jgi:hypothetical protein
MTLSFFDESGVGIESQLLTFTESLFLLSFSDGLPEQAAKRAMPDKSNI